MKINIYSSDEWIKVSARKEFGDLDIFTPPGLNVRRVLITPGLEEMTIIVLEDIYSGQKAIYMGGSPIFFGGEIQRSVIIRDEGIEEITLIVQDKTFILKLSPCFDIPSSIQEKGKADLIPLKTIY